MATYNKLKAKHLGVTLKSNLKFRTYFNKIRQEAGRITHMLYTLINGEGKLNRTNKLRVPTITHAGEVYRIVDSNQMQKLQTLLNKVQKCVYKHLSTLVYQQWEDK